MSGTPRKTEDASAKEARLRFSGLEWVSFGAGHEVVGPPVHVDIKYTTAEY
jgi:hypothetical protein